jgi:long-chain acyl-CoA synthetase
MFQYRLGARPLHEYLREHARRQPEKTAYHWYGNAVSYAALDRMSDALGARLAELGVAKGDRVALFLNNCPQYVVAHFAIQKLGAVVGPCSPLFKQAELEYQLRDLGAQVIVTADALHPVLASVQSATAVRQVIVTNYGDLLPARARPEGETGTLPARPSGRGPIDLPPELLAERHIPDGAIDLMSIIGEAPLDGGFQRPPAPELTMDDLALLTYTSGTTGLPKGAMLTYGNALFKSAVTDQGHDVRADDIMLAVAPLYHIAGMLVGIGTAIYAGATTVLLHRFDALAALQAIDHYKVSWWYSIAPMNVAAMKVPQAERFRLDSLRLNPATSFGITLTQPLAEQWAAFTGGAQLLELAYGLSETHTCDSLMPPTAVKWGTHGKLAPGVQCRIVDPESGRNLPPGQTGEILMKSPGNFRGYWNKPEATATTLRDGWVHTGDMGRLDEDGYLTFLGRFKEMIKVSGYSVFPEEVETLLIRHPAIAAAAVVGVADETKGEVVKAGVVLNAAHAGASAPTPEEIIAWCRDNMSAYKVPRIVQIMDALPATGAGKVLRRLLK